MKWNPFKKDEKEEGVSGVAPAGMPKPEDMNMVQRFAYKRIMAMNPQERQKLMQKMLKPENVQKHKAEILEQLEAMRKGGQMSDDQIRLAKARLGLK